MKTVIENATGKETIVSDEVADVVHDLGGSTTIKALLRNLTKAYGLAGTSAVTTAESRILIAACLNALKSLDAHGRSWLDALIPSH